MDRTRGLYTSNTAFSIRRHDDQDGERMPGGLLHFVRFDVTLVGP